jgi:hypothetical protein
VAQPQAVTVGQPQAAVEQHSQHSPAAIPAQLNRVTVDCSVATQRLVGWPDDSLGPVESSDDYPVVKLSGDSLDPVGSLGDSLDPVAWPSDCRAAVSSMADWGASVGWAAADWGALAGWAQGMAQADPVKAGSVAVGQLVVPRTVAAAVKRSHQAAAG